MIDAKNDKSTITPSRMVLFDFYQINRKAWSHLHRQEVMQIYHAIDEATSLYIKKFVQVQMLAGASAWQSRQFVLTGRLLPFPMPHSFGSVPNTHSPLSNHALMIEEILL